MRERKEAEEDPPFVHNTDESFCGGCYTFSLTWTVSKNVYPFFRVYGLTSVCKGLFSSPKKKDKKNRSREKRTHFLLSTPLREKASHQSTSKSSFCVPCRLVHEESSKWCGFFFFSRPGDNHRRFRRFFVTLPPPPPPKQKTGKNRYHRRRKSRLVIRGGGVEETGRTTREADDAMRKASSAEATTTTTTTTTTTASGGDEDDETNTVFSTKPSLLGKLGQSMNVAGISLFLKLAVSDASLAVPHVDCESIQDIDWFKLKQAGFTAVIFDKDNTLTIPHADGRIRRC